jgi:hypothetical protein
LPWAAKRDTASKNGNGLHKRSGEMSRSDEGERERRMEERGWDD